MSSYLKILDHYTFIIIILVFIQLVDFLSNDGLKPKRPLLNRYSVYIIIIRSVMKWLNTVSVESIKNIVCYQIYLKPVTMFYNVKVIST